jgi:DNA-binding PadR family transcriptional regulator
MPGFSTGDTTPQMMVLGLVAEEPDTVAGVGRRLADQFASASFPRSSAHKSLPRLAERGFVRLVEAGPPGETTRDRYEATPAGIEYFRRWFCRSELPPVVRDAMRCKLELLKRDDVAGLLRTVREEQAAYTAAYDIARTRVLSEQRSRRARPGPVDWNARVLSLRNKDEVAFWGLMARRHERLGDELQRLLAEGGADGAVR